MNETFDYTRQSYPKGENVIIPEDKAVEVPAVGKNNFVESVAKLLKEKEKPLWEEIYKPFQWLVDETQIKVRKPRNLLEMISDFPMQGLQFRSSKDA